MTQPPQDPGPSASPDWTSPNAPPDDGPAPYQGTYGAEPGAVPPPARPAPGMPGHIPPGYGPPGYGPPGRHQVLYAGRWARLGAFLLDSFVVAIVSAPFVLQAIRWDRMTEIAESGGTPSQSDMYDIPRLVVGYAIASVLAFAYFTVQHAKWGQTLGKRAAGIQVVRADDHRAASWGQIATRQAFVSVLAAVSAVLNLVSGVGVLVSLIGVLDDAWILWDDRRQSLHDKVAKTVVVKKGPWAPDPYTRH